MVSRRSGLIMTVIQVIETGKKFVKETNKREDNVNLTRPLFVGFQKGNKVKWKEIFMLSLEIPVRIELRDD